MLIMMSIFMTTAISSCSDDDETVSGETQASQILVKADSYIEDSYAGDNDYVYYIIADNSSEAKTICQDIIGQSWDGTAQTITLNDNYGTIKLIPNSQEGVYVEIVINIKGIDNINLNICSQEYVESENLPRRR
jgi:hypothetical protein